MHSLGSFILQDSFKSISTCFRVTKYEPFHDHFALILALYIVMPDIICPLTFFFGDAVALL